MFDAEEFFAAGGLLFWKQIIQRSSHHVGDQTVIGHFRHRLGADMGAVTHNGDGIADFKDFFQFVGNKDDGNTLFLQNFDGFHQLIHFLVGKGGSRLIHDDQTGFGQNGFSDFHHLLHADSQLSAKSMRIDVDTERMHDLFCFFVHICIVQKEAFFLIIIDKQIVRDA